MAKMPKTYHRSRKEPGGSPPAGSQQHQPAPNGGEVRAVPMDKGKMPKRSRIKPITHTSAQTDLGKMPKRVSGMRERDPHYR